MLRPEELLALHHPGRLHPSFYLPSHLQEASNMTTRANSQFPRPDFHRQDKQPYGPATDRKGGGYPTALNHAIGDLGLRPLEKFLFVTELATGGSAVKLPVDLDSVAVHPAVPGPALST